MQRRRHSVSSSCVFSVPLSQCNMTYTAVVWVILTEGFDSKEKRIFREHKFKVQHDRCCGWWEIIMESSFFSSVFGCCIFFIFTGVLTKSPVTTLPNLHRHPCMLVFGVHHSPPHKNHNIIIIILWHLDHHRRGPSNKPAALL